ncbi:conserved hypothetical protein [Klebsiella pneumoniae subsp. pneumoniae Ecl8]|jgi:hypothetical protein|uniref:Uncharacterized protein n=1 Tax=Klebsiella pneumoniae TaxID=573 RepID=A0A3G1IEH3_KLEPN|nr:hypothetical protein KPN2242_26026 [Klebsiella pneumoniae KCTC 2242]ASF89442.1 hypothetical protein pPUTH1_0323 [Klebsiella pneumoniae]UWM14659.1 hypothetical protein pA_gene0002 [Klebsiella pneumoniae]CCN32661.1 conserved hypothetical protein [Klebsiella pneumoniae subsp. pneumoniae Ecl8]
MARDAVTDDILNNDLAYPVGKALRYIPCNLLISGSQ